MTSDEQHAEQNRILDEITRQLEQTSIDLTLRLGTISDQLAQLKALSENDTLTLMEMSNRTAMLFVSVPIKMLMTAATLLICISDGTTAQKLNKALKSDEDSLHRYATEICDVITSILRDRENAGVNETPSIH